MFREHEKLYRAPSQAGPNSTRQQRKAAQKAMENQDFSTVIDFMNLDACSAENLALIEEIQPTAHESRWFAPIKKAYAVKSVPGTNILTFYFAPEARADVSLVAGLVFIPKPFSDAQEKYWVHRCMKGFTVGSYLSENIGILVKNTFFSPALMSFVTRVFGWTGL